MSKRREKTLRSTEEEMYKRGMAENRCLTRLNRHTLAVTIIFEKQCADYGR